MLLAVEVLDAVAGFVVLTESGLLLSFVKDRFTVPGNSLGVGGTIMKGGLQKVDCTQNDIRVSETAATRTRTSRKVRVYLRRGHRTRGRKRWIWR